MSFDSAPTITTAGNGITTLAGQRRASAAVLSARLPAEPVLLRRNGQPLFSKPAVHASAAVCIAIARRLVDN
jgi:hypothetical protein